ncbi:serine protease [Halobacillus sp. A1]|uniref:S1C family serine protease n=1 Tax=Halobacillus sp. A1 TaxID=2880262 RepID=UPI0020A66462|nr:serine protease [Halobacillus sp. A1]MCP3032422.1 serine protease [Halobacillus sp. A1]
MSKYDDERKDIIDDDLYEEIDEEEMYELVQAERREALEKARREKQSPKEKRPFPKWIFYLIAFMMVMNIVAVLPNTFSIPAVDFLITSAKLSTDDDIKEFKRSIVVVDAGESKGTGFSISDDGTILTNHHVIEGERRISVGFQEEGLYQAEVVESFPDIDLAILQVEGGGFPSLDLADETSFEESEPFSFIGNPLSFTGVANEGTIIDYIELKNWEEPVLMLDAPVYRGNSGSPVINEEGEVIAVVFATLREDEHGRVGLAVPIDYYYEKLEAS